MEVCQISTFQYLEINELNIVNLVVDIVVGGPLAERLMYWLQWREKVKKSEKGPAAYLVLIGAASKQCKLVNIQPRNELDKGLQWKHRFCTYHTFMLLHFESLRML